ncbi:MAG: zf-HC2 domain-containing protein [Blastocatellia bacterium]|nr:zf-HC2 domain-containing protein [Blastocatellia bacterium]
MDCDFAEKISLFVDGELSPDESERVSRHILACSACKQAQDDFLRLRREIKAYDFELGPLARERALERILSSQKTSLWKRRVALPAPAFALILIVLIASWVWSVSLLLAKPQPSGGGIRAEKGTRERETVSQTGLDLSRYDGGGRAVIYKTRRADAGR